VRIALALILAVALAEPYWWPVGGWPGALFGDSLTLAGAGLPLVMAWRARGRSTEAPTAGATGDRIEVRRAPS
jgi:hypothetical protein